MLILSSGSGLANTCLGYCIGKFPFINTFLTTVQNRIAVFFGQENVVDRGCVYD